MNPDSISHNIYKNTCLHPLTIANTVCDELKYYQPDLREPISRALEKQACKNYRTDPEFRKTLAACHNENMLPESSPEDARDWLKTQMTSWAKTNAK